MNGEYMGLMKRSDVAEPAALLEEVVEVPELGGDVVVRGLLLRDRLALALGRGADKHAMVATLLAATVLDAEGVALWSAEQWERFGARHFHAAMRLFDVARRLCVMDAEEAEKN